MKDEPQTRTASRGATRRADPRLVEVPFLRLAPDELQGPGRVVQRTLDRRYDAIFRRFGNEAVFDCDDADALATIGLDFGLVLAAVPPTAAVNVKHDRRRF